MPRKPQKITERFWERVRLPSDDLEECWEWMGALNKEGYGSIYTAQADAVAVHRFSYMLHTSHVIPEGMCVIHTCGVRHCVNPLHLRVGPPLDIVRYRALRRRRNVLRGEGPIWTGND